MPLSSLLPLVLSHLERSRCVYRCDRDSGLGRKITELDHAYARVAKEGTATLTHERTRTHYLHDARVRVGGPCSRSRWCLFSAVLDLNKPARRPAFAHQGSLGGPRRRTRGRSRGRVVVVAPCRCQDDMHKSGRYPFRRPGALSFGEDLLVEESALELAPQQLLPVLMTCDPCLYHMHDLTNDQNGRPGRSPTEMMRAAKCGRSDLSANTHDSRTGGKAALTHERESDMKYTTL